MASRAKVNKGTPETPESINQPQTEEHPPETPMPIVGIGASAGGLEAFQQFFRAMPADSGLAFILVPHLDPNHESFLTEILQRCTAMPVIEAHDQMAVAPNRVHVVPPNRDMAVFHRTLQLTVPDLPRGQRMPIDTFLRSLAEDQGDNAIGIILSGTGTDGTLGLRAIQGAGGITLVQEPPTAKYDGMPVSAIQAGYATYVLPVEKMPETLMATARQMLASQKQHKPEPMPMRGMNRVLLQLRASTGHDFSLYKKSTLTRRIQRRMAQHDIEDAEIYARYLKENPAEAQLLFKEMLINVTSFFRDPEAFEALKVDILPKLLKDKPDDQPFRAWVAGCASGEEAYSLAILLREYMDENHREFIVQLYATDLNEEMIATARAGCYPPNIAADIAPRQLHHYFTKEVACYRVKKEIREMVVFAVQNVIKDPPFTKLDLLSCRNLMIYLEPELQSRLLPSFHYALKPGGILFLSPSESIGGHPDLFAAENRKWKLYRAVHSPASRTHAMIAHDLSQRDGRASKAMPPSLQTTREPGLAELTQRVLLQSYAPPSVVVDAKGTVLFIHGDTGNFLRPPPGKATLNLIDMAREGLQPELRNLLQAASHGTPLAARDVMVRNDGGTQSISISAQPLSGNETAQGLLLVSFAERQQAPDGQAAPRRRSRKTCANETARIEELEHELAYTRDNLQATIEEQQASNEELQSTNEELQSTNEELETSKEELQSVNEELVTVNAELQAKIEQLAGMQNDMKNLLDNINVGIIFLDQNLAVRRFTREATQIYRLAAADVGRSLADIKCNLEGDDPLLHAQEVMNSLTPWQRELCSANDTWYLAHIQPYRTLDNLIGGVVLTFTDVSEHKRASDQVRRNEALMKMAGRLAGLGCWQLDVASNSMSLSPEARTIFGAGPGNKPLPFEDFLSMLYLEDRQAVAEAMRATITTKTTLDTNFRIFCPDGMERKLRVRGEAICEGGSEVTRLIGSVLDITELQNLTVRAQNQR